MTLDSTPPSGQQGLGSMASQYQFAAQSMKVKIILLSNYIVAPSDGGDFLIRLHSNHIVRVCVARAWRIVSPLYGPWTISPKCKVKTHQS